MHNIQIDSEFQAAAPVAQWLNTELLVPFSHNVRTRQNDDDIEAIAESMREKGFLPEKPLLVRNQGDRFEIVGGHTRHAAAKRAGLERVLCVVRDMDDDEATLRNASDNVATPPPWFDLCLYVYRNAVKSSKTGLSRAALTAAATGKTGGYADKLSFLLSGAGQVIEQSYLEVSLLPADRNLTQHCAAIAALPPEQYAPMLALLLEHGWSVKDTQAAVERVKSVVAARPAWFKAALPVARIAIEPSFAKTVLASLVTLAACHDRLPDVVTLYSLHDTDETKEINGREHRKREAVPQEFAARAHFEAAMVQADLTSARAIEGCYRDIARRIDAEAHASEAWVPVLTDAEEKARAGRAEELARLQDRASFMPRLLQGDVVEQLRGLPDNHFDLVCIDPPYNMDKAGWDSFGSGKDFALWARPWLKECQRVLKDTGAIYVFGINRMLSHLQHEMDGLGLHYRNWITWDTIQGAGGGLWVNRTESILYYSKTADTFEDADAVKLERHEDNVREYKGREYFFKNPSNIWRFPCVDDKHPDRTEHPTQKPTELIERIVRASSPAGGRVLDCFMGSGTTGVACMRTRRHATGIDKSAQYIAIAQARFDATEVPAA
jgi:site-specific DNA-methyltransferase (adenine-specific)